MINSERLRGLLAPTEFAFDFESTAERRLVFFRAASVPDLYERVEVACRGHVPSGIPAVATVAATIGHGPNAITDLRVLTEVATVPRYGYTPLRDEKDAIEWERRVASIAPGQARSMVDTRGSALLNNTEPARSAARKYFQRLTPEILLAESRLAERLTPDQVSEVEQICRWRDSTLFRVAAILIVLFREDVERPGANLRELNPVRDPELMRRLLIIAMLLENGGEL